MRRPKSPENKSFIGLWSIASFSLASSVAFAYSSTVMPAEARRIAGSHAAEIIGTVLSLGCLSDVVALVVSAASDATPPTATRLGSRLPYVAAGAVSEAVGMTAFAAASTVMQLIAGYVLLVSGQAVLHSITHAMVPEVVSSAQRGRVSSMFTFNSLVGSIFGLALVLLQAPPWLAAAIVCVLSLGAFVLQCKTAVSSSFSPVNNPADMTEPFPPQSDAQGELAEGVRTVRRYTGKYVPDFVADYLFDVRIHRDFAMCLLMRVFANAGFACLSYIQLFLGDCIGVADSDLARAAGFLSLASVVAGVSFGLPVGALGDRVGKKVPMVAGLAILVVAMPLASYVSSLSVMYIFAFAFGLGNVLFFSLESGVIFDTLPSKKDSAKFLSESSISTSLGIVVGQQLCSWLLRGFKVTGAGRYYSPEGYHVLFTASAAVLGVAMAFCLMIDLPRAKAARRAVDIHLPVAISPAPDMESDDVRSRLSRTATVSAAKEAGTPPGSPPRIPVVPIARKFPTITEDTPPPSPIPVQRHNRAALLLSR